jgi:tripartite-type tricarboxylate transporter receptor subunit TctC
MEGCIMKGRPRGTMAAAIVLTFFLMGALAPLCAETYPSKPVRFILPFPAGGLTDVLGRIMGQKFADRLGQPIVPENRPGAGGNLGIEIAAKARPDGYTIVLSAPALAISPHLYKQLNYDPVKDLAPISLVAEISNVLCVRSSLPVKSLGELVALAKANPGNSITARAVPARRFKLPPKCSRVLPKSVSSTCRTRASPRR